MIKDYAADNAMLLERAAGGDESARNQLIEQNLGLVKSIVRRFLGRGHEAEDLFQIGCIGLIRAAERFDSSFGVKFSTYAVPMIMGEIKRFIRDDGIIKVSRSLKETATNALKIKERIINETGREPALSEIAKELKISVTDLATAFEAQVKPESLYITMDDGKGESKPLVEKIESKEDDVGRMIDRVTISSALESFPQREKEIVYLRYFRQKTQAEVAKKLNISQVQVSRLEKKILLKLRSILTKE